MRNGTHVSKGDLLVRFDHSTLASQLEQARSRKGTLELQAERLSALVEKRELRPLAVAGQFPVLANKQRTIYRAQKASRDAELHLANRQIAQRDSEVEQQLDTVVALSQEVSLLKEQVQIRDKLSGGQLIAKTEDLAIRSQSARNWRDCKVICVVRRAASRSHCRREKKPSNAALIFPLGSTRNYNCKQEKSPTSWRKCCRRFRAWTIAFDTQAVGTNRRYRAGLGHDPNNAVVKPGQVIMEIVPVANTMLVEARLSPGDIGHVRIGQSVDVKVASYDPSKFGIIDGKVETISAYTYLDDRAQTYYRSEISLANAYLGRNANELRIIPGMTMVADITTGSKTLLDHLLKPINRGLQSAFTER